MDILPARRTHYGCNQAVALQLGSAGGIWTRESGLLSAMEGTLVAIDEDRYWQRQGDPSRLDARWFGVQGDGRHNDAPALQRAIDAPAPEWWRIVVAEWANALRAKSYNQSLIYFISGSNCGLLSKHFEPGHRIGQGSMLQFIGCDGIIIQPADNRDRQEERPPPVGGVFAREFGIAGTGRQDGQCGIRVLKGDNWRWGSTMVYYWIAYTPSTLIGALTLKPAICR